MVKSMDIGPLVGVGKFFEHVSARMAMALPIGHESGLRGDSHAASTRPGSFNVFSAEYYATERAENFLGFDGLLGNRRTIAAGQRVLLGTLPTCAMVFDSTIYRSDGAEELFYMDADTETVVEFTSYTKLKEAAASLHLNRFIRSIPVPADGETLPAPVRLPISDCHGGENFAAFPAFDLYATRIDGCRMTGALESWPTIKLADAAGMTGPLVVAYEPGAVMLPQVPSCEDWLVWMKPAAAIPEGSFMSMKTELLVANK